MKIEITETQYDEILCSLPPIYLKYIDGKETKAAFANSEPVVHTRDGYPLYNLAWMEEDKYFTSHGIVELKGIYLNGVLMTYDEAKIQFKTGDIVLYKVRYKEHPEERYEIRQLLDDQALIRQTDDFSSVTWVSFPDIVYIPKGYKPYSKFREAK